MPVRQTASYPLTHSNQAAQRNGTTGPSDCCSPVAKHEVFGGVQFCRCAPGQSAPRSKEQGPMELAAFAGTPGEMSMAFVRCYTGADGQSHFEDLDLLPPEMERSIEQAASSLTFTRSPNGRFS